MKREAMLKAWELFRKGFGTFAESLKKAWSLVKKLAGETVSLEEAAAIVRKSARPIFQQFNRADLYKNGNYTGKGRLTYGKLRVWVKGDLVRMYADEYLDGIFVREVYSK